MTFRFADSPALISLQRLAEMDKAEPGTYLATPKIDGRRRIVTLDKGKWKWSAKNREDAQPVPADLRAESIAACFQKYRGESYTPDL
jgi:hypothetical protein